MGKILVSALILLATQAQAAMKTVECNFTFETRDEFYDLKGVSEENRGARTGGMVIGTRPAKGTPEEITSAVHDSCAEGVEEIAKARCQEVGASYYNVLFGTFQDGKKIKSFVKPEEVKRDGKPLFKGC